MNGNVNRFAMLTMLRNEEELQTAKETVREGMMHALPAVNVNFHFSHFLRQGDLFLYGTEPMICQLKRKGSWVGCLGWKRGARTTNRFDSNCIFQKILIKMESMTFENSLLFSNNRVNFENGVKNHILHDSPGQSCPAQPVSRWPTLFVFCGLMVKSENLSPRR